MRLAQKMMLVPAGRVPLEISALSELDQAMTTVINNNKLSTLEKINLYSKILKKNFVIEARLKNKNVQSIPTTKESTPVKMEQELKEEPTDDSEIRKMDSSNPEEDILDLSQIFEPVKQSFSEIVKSSPSKNKEVVKKLVKIQEKNSIKN